jgi:hypothetical protein
MHKCLYVGQCAEYGIGNAPKDKLALKPLLLWAQPTGIRLGLKPHMPAIGTNQQQIKNTGENSQGFHKPSCFLGTFSTIGNVEGDTIGTDRPKVSDSCGMESDFWIGHHVPAAKIARPISSGI